MNRNSVLMILTGAALIAAGIGYYYYNKPTASVSDLKTDFVTNAKDFYQEFDENEDQATIKYQNKVVELEGLVDSVFNNDQGGKMIMINTEGGMSSIIFELDTSLHQASTYSKGDKLRLKGICSGKLIDIVLNRSVVLDQK